MHRVLVLGSAGQLGSEIQSIASDYDYDFFFTTREKLDLNNKEKVSLFIQTNKVDTIINCAAYTAVDKAETEQEASNLLNHYSVAHLANLAKENEVKLIHISTDYVFDGENFKPYIETDLTSPNSTYGQTKLDGELALQTINPKYSIIIRTSWVYSSFGANFVKTMLRLGKEKESLTVIFDQVGTPTYAKDLAKTILNILPKMKNDNVETYHYSNEGITSWYDFAKEIMDITTITCSVYPIESKDYPTAAKRPHYSVLNKTKIKTEFSITIPHWKNSLKKCLTEMGEIK